MKKEQLFVLGLGLLTLLFYMKAVTSFARLAVLDDYLVIYNRNGITSDTALQAGKQNDQRKNPYSFTIFGENVGVTLENPDLYRIVNDVPKLSVYGSTSLLFGNAPALEKNDYIGCLIDAKTAMSLFGMTDVVGSIVRYLDNNYVIRGVLPNVSSVFVTQINPNEKIDNNTLRVDQKNTSPLDTVMIRVDGNLNSQVKTEFALMGIAGKKVAFQTLKQLLHLYLLLFPISLTVILLSLLRGYAKDSINLTGDLSIEGETKVGVLRFKYPLMYWVWISLFIFVFFAFFWHLVQHIRLPKDIVPPKWSDFEFWSDLLAEKKEELVFFFKIPKRTPEMPYVWAMVKVAIYGTLSLFAFLLTLLGSGIIVKNKSDF